MRRNIAAFALVLAAASGLAPAHGDARPPDAESEAPRLFAELGAGPIVGLDSPLRGAAAGVLAALAWGPIEAGIRASAAFDRSLGSASIRLDLELGLGGGMRVIAGGIVPLSPAILEPEGAALPLEAAAWPCRFGLSARIAELGSGPLGSRAAISAAMVYSAYRVSGQAASSAEAALSGAAAFAACVELSATVSLAWGGRRALEREAADGP